MEAGEHDIATPSAKFPLPEPGCSTAAILPQQELGPDGAQCDIGTAAGSEEPTLNVPQDPFSHPEEIGGQDGVESASVEGRPMCEGNEAVARMDETAVGGSNDGKDCSALCGEGQGGGAVVGESGLIVAAALAISSKALSPALVSRRHEADLIETEENEEAGNVTVGESSGAGSEDMMCSGAAEAFKEDKKEDIGGAHVIFGALDGSHRVVEDTGKRTGEAIDKVVEEDTAVDHMEEVKSQSQTVAEADNKEMEEMAVATVSVSVEDCQVVVNDTAKETDGITGKIMKEANRVDPVDEFKGHSEAVEDVHKNDLEEIAITSVSGAVQDSLLVEDAAKETDDIAEKAMEDDIKVDQMIVFKVHGKHTDHVTDKVEQDGIGLDHMDMVKTCSEAAAEEIELLETEQKRPLHIESEAAGSTFAHKEAVDSEDESMEAVGAAPDSTSTGTVKVEVKNTEDDMLVGAEVTAKNNRSVDDDMLEVEMKKAPDNMVIDDNDAHGDDEVMEIDETQELELENKEDDDDVLNGAEGETGEDMEVHHGDAYAAEETDVTEEVENEEEMSRSGAGTKRKRGRAPKGGTSRTPSRKMEEDVCFICFDGGDLVLCDRRGCPKAYHPSCVNRDEAFFRTKGQWNCGWHLCSSCGKNAYYMCYTCTYSLCKTCIKDGSISSIRRNKGFCRTCMKTIVMIEDDLKEDDTMGQVDFDDKSSWEYLFKDYYLDLKEKLSLTKEELTRAASLLKGSVGLVGKQQSPEALDDSENSDGVATPKRRQSKRRGRSHTVGRGLPPRIDLVGSGNNSFDENSEWASKELVEFVIHMRNGDRSIPSQYDVQALLLEYIKRNKLRDPKRKSQIICDQRLQDLFGKPRVGHFEMLKLLESHYFMKDRGDLQGADVDTDANQSEVDLNSDLQKTGRDKRRKTRKKGDQRGIQSNLDDYAAIDTHNINLMYLRRNLLDDLIEDTETFHEKVVGSFVRIRISGNNQKQDLYRLVPVVGTSKAAEQYKVGKKMTNFILEILNLNKTEIITIDIISNQEFTEDECKRLRQSIKCGLISRLTVGNVQEKAMALQEARVKDWLEAETVRLSHLRDRASDMGRRKELRECVEKLQLLKTPDERQRRLDEIPEIHVDPKMDPSYESEEDEAKVNKRQESYIGGVRRTPSFRLREPISPQKGGSAAYDSWNSGTRTAPMTPNRELTRNLSSKGIVSARDDYGADIVNENSWGRAKERETPYQLIGRDNMSTLVSPSPDVGASRIIGNAAVPETRSAVAPQSAPKINDSEKMWHYQDPAGKIQGPFSMMQLRKWNNTGYFPADLRIWKTTEKKEDSFLLTDALNGKFQRDPTPPSNNLEQNRGSLMGKAALSSVEVPKFSGGERGSSVSGANLPSPTPGQTSVTQMKGSSMYAAGSMSQASMLASDASHSLSQGAQKPDSVSGTLLHSQATLPGNFFSNQAVSLQNLVQAVARSQAQSNPVRVEAIMPSSARKPDPVSVPTEAQVQAPWASGGGGRSSIPSVNAYASPGSANPWQGPTNQTNVQSPTPPSTNWPLGNNNKNSSNANANAGNYNVATHNSGWTPQMQVQGSAGWSAPNPVPVNPSMNWATTTQRAPVGNHSWPPPAQRQVQAPVNPTHMGWAPSGNPNPGFNVQGQAQASPMVSNSSPWASQGNQNGDGTQRNVQWNRHSSFGSSGGGGPSRMGGVCWFFRENGYCKKGASCNYRHT
ncbi:hypothetical protein SAY86_004349 [Trapa natans]|uniref:Zinc finger CCCH domain-containing protein 19 n=1 Tax=Trapa natans TaxID=22666 RepID=A0AAN7MV32_TRANT|nr:hypothetical protein SAY86_004349 [Trapa natans]